MVAETIDKEREVFEKYVKEVADKEKIENYDFVIENVCAKGDNYMGDVSRIIISGVKHDKAIERRVIIKQMKIINEFFNVFHEREIKMYTKIFPQFDTFQKRHNVDDEYRFNLIKCFSTTDAVIVLEDLSEIGCKVSDKFTSPDFTHASKVISQLAKLHGLSFAMEKLQPETFQQIKNDYSHDFWEPNFLEIGSGKCFRSLYKNSLGFIRNEKAKARLSSIKDDVSKLMRGYTGQRARSVLCHGDPWTTNILYRYNDNVPQEAYLIDWQASNFYSPVIDIFYYIFLCTDSEFRSLYYEKLLRTYHQTLTDTLKEYHLDVNVIYSFDDFQKDLKELSPFGIITAMHMLRFMTVTPDFVPNIEEMFQSEQDMFCEDLCDGLKLYADRLNDVVEDFIKYDYLM